MRRLSDVDRATRFVFLHGFTQTHHHWHAVAHLLARRVDDHASLVFVDLPGHGLSHRIEGPTPAEVGSGTAGGIDHVGRRLVDLAGTGTYIGYSMGGRSALVAAADGDPRIERLVLIGATPGIETSADREERRRIDERRARRLEQIGVDGFLDEWLSMPMFAGLPADDEALEQRRRNTVHGLAHSLRHHGTGVQTPLWDRLGSIEVPVLVLAGELDPKFRDIGSRMASMLPRGTFAPIGGAGHAAHLERPVDTVERIATWFADDD